MKQITKRGSKVVQQNNKQEIIRLAETGMTVKRIGERVGVSHQCIYKFLNEIGIKPKEIRRKRNISACHILKNLGLDYYDIGHYIGLSEDSVGLYVKMPEVIGGQVPIVINSEKLHLRDDDGKLIHSGRYHCKSLGGNSILLLGIDRTNKAHFTTYKTVLGKAKIDPRNGDINN